jgi:hypothetical protein
MEYRLVALLPPKNSEMEIIRIQNTMFTEFGLVSGLSLPPCIPLVYIRSRAPKKEIAKTLSLPLQGFRIEVSGLVIDQGFFVLRAEPKEKIAELANRIRKALGEKMERTGTDHILFHPFAGFFAACNETSVPIESAVKAVSTIDGIRFPSFSLAVIDIETFAGGGPWWTDVSWEIVFEKRLPKPKASKS